ncbi:hypothetical protein KQX54_004169 [Cotesia glomerata]|uniref:Uncharacterized protein n=1 Tax=Cotesia glomerata TaxID=32391 RepID=A0AAV7IES5_COTGL|nr:hypothetical protein KQX54_004169 [Cotesia glomerata]
MITWKGRKKRRGLLVLKKLILLIISDCVSPYCQMRGEDIGCSTIVRLRLEGSRIENSPVLADNSGHRIFNTNTDTLESLGLIFCLVFVWCRLKVGVEKNLEVSGVPSTEYSGWLYNSMSRDQVRWPDISWTYKRVFYEFKDNTMTDANCVQSCLRNTTVHPVCISIHIRHLTSNILRVHISYHCALPLSNLFLCEASR